MKLTLDCREMTAFISGELVNGRKCIGNPALVCLGNQIPTYNLMKKLSENTDFPIIVFLDCSYIKERKVIVRYLCGNGRKLNLCGHGTIAAMKALHDKFCLPSDTIINFIPDTEEYVELQNQNVVGYIYENEYSIIFPELKRIKVIEQYQIEAVAKILNIETRYIKEIFLGELGDIVTVIDNNNIIHALSPNIANIPLLGKVFEKSFVRTVMVTCKSNIKTFDFETRVFAPECDADEDIACGSANCSIAHYWAETLGKKYMKMFYPYKYYDEGKRIGGIQKIKIRDKCVEIISNVKACKQYYLECDTTNCCIVNK